REREMKRVIAALVLLTLLATSIAYYLRAQNRGVVGPVGEVRQVGLAAGAGVPVTVGIARRRAMRQSITLAGTFRAEKQAAVSAKASGRVQDVLVRQGDRVSAGHELVVLERPDTVSPATSDAAVEAALVQ